MHRAGRSLARYYLKTGPMKVKCGRCQSRLNQGVFKLIPLFLPLANNQPWAGSNLALYKACQWESSFPAPSCISSRVLSTLVMSDKPLSYTQLLSQLMQKKRFTDFQWAVFTDTGATQRHKATFYYRSSPIYTSLHWHATAANARDETAFYVLPVVTQALGGSIPVAGYLIPSLSSYIS
jgi:hypothetical protein